MTAAEKVIAVPGEVSVRLEGKGPPGVRTAIKIPVNRVSPPDNEGLEKRFALPEGKAARSRIA